MVSQKQYKLYIDKLSMEEKKLLNMGLNFYEVSFENVGGLVMPLIIQFTYRDGSKEIERIPAEIWRLNDKKVTKVFVKKKEVVEVTRRELCIVHEHPHRNAGVRLRSQRGSEGLDLLEPCSVVYKGWGLHDDNPGHRQASIAKALALETIEFARVQRRQRTAGQILLDLDQIAEVVAHPLQHPSADVLVHHLAAAEAQR